MCDGRLDLYGSCPIIRSQSGSTNHGRSSHHSLHSMPFSNLSIVGIMSRIESNRPLDMIYSPYVHEKLRHLRWKNPERGSGTSGNPNRPLPKSGSDHMSPSVSPRAL
ncbi:hypothetical protein Adt_02322 [Abeliophyllum distichum]|uniref:Uncharacterized protein n=1 Tax=Abeliophyllum distichum TaxID=126358 RepID=A0ABD1VVC5_9LAMI